MSFYVLVGTIEVAYKDAPEIGWIPVPTPMPARPHIWDGAIDNDDGTFGNIRTKNATELADDTRITKKIELRAERKRRVALLISPDDWMLTIAQSVRDVRMETGSRASQSQKDKLDQLETMMTSIDALKDAELNAIIAIDALPDDAAQIDAYDVTTGWP